MIVIMKQGATAAEIGAVIARVQQLGLTPHPIYGEFRTVIAIVGEAMTVEPDVFAVMAGVDVVNRIGKPYKLASRISKPEDTVIALNGVTIGGKKLVVMAGPCSVESRTQLLETAHAVKEAGAAMLRGGAFKPRTSPYEFQGLGLKGLKLLAKARKETGLPIITELLSEARQETGLYVVTEVMTPEAVPLVSQYADVLQIGARNMQNYGLLNAVGRTQRPVLLKRGMMSTIEELLMSAEYIMSNGNYRVMLCERGIRTFEPMTRNTFDLNAVPLLKQLSHLPVIGDPSHGTGHWNLVAPMAKAAVACGADGLIIEVHPHPEEAISDGAQSLKPEKFAQMMRELKPLAEALGREL